MPTAPFYVIGNWKSNKTIDEVVIWARDFETLYKKQPFSPAKVKVVVGVPFPLLTTLKSLVMLKRLPFELAAQNVSSYPAGAYTGEICAEMIKDMVSFSLVGHSERRKYFKETDEDLVHKVEQARLAGIEPVYCVQDEAMAVPEQVKFVGYEPVWAIGTGKAETAENANQVAGNIKKRLNRAVTVIYGGSVTADNVNTYVKMEHIGGVLPGGASLKPDTFYNLILNAATS